MLKLRDYQKRALNKLYESLKTHNKVLLALPTGAGKTVMMARWALQMADKGFKTAIIVDRIELVQQTYHQLGCIASVLARSKCYQFDPINKVQIIMLQTANRRMQQLLDIQFDYIFFDEIHNYKEGKMFAALCDCQKHAKIIGVSATPIDDRGYLLSGFDDCIEGVQTQQLIDEGYLVKPVYYAPQDYNLDLRCIRMTGGDYDIGQLDELMANVKCAEKIYQHWSNVAKERKTIVFCSSVKQSHILCEYFNKDKSIDARVVYGEMPADKRERILYYFSLGKINVLFSVGILVTGYDEPTVDCIVFANPTKILRRYLQQAGRGLRIAPNKKDCLMLDCADVVREHGFCNDIRFFRLKLREPNECMIKQCPECGAIVGRNTKVCPYCGYAFDLEEDQNVHLPKKEIDRLEKAFDMQNEIKQQISELVDSRGYKSGYKWYLFLDCLKTKRPTESAIRFFKRKLTKIKHIKQKKWNLAALRYD